MRGILITLSLVAATDAAFAHGGCFRGPRGTWKRGIPCDCARIECNKCATPALRAGNEISRCNTKVSELKRWGDIAQLRVTVTFETKRKQGSVEGYVRLRPAPVFAAVSGWTHPLLPGAPVYSPGLPGRAVVFAQLRPSAEGRQMYLWVRRRFPADPLLVQRRAGGDTDVRAFPVSRMRPMLVVLNGYAIRVRKGNVGVRLYRTGRRYLAVGPKDEVRFLSEHECRKRFATGVAVVVPCVPALETAFTGRGDAAPGEAAVLAGFPDGVRMPPFVGPDVWVPAPALPVAQFVRADPNDPEPPPEPPKRVSRLRAWEPNDPEPPPAPLDKQR